MVVVRLVVAGRGELGATGRELGVVGVSAAVIRYHSHLPSTALQPCQIMTVMRDFHFHRSITTHCAHLNQLTSVSHISLLQLVN